MNAEFVSIAQKIIIPLGIFSAFSFLTSASSSANGPNSFTCGVGAKGKTMLTPDEIINKLKPMNLSAVSIAIDVNYNILWKFANQKLKRVPYDLVKILSDYFNAK